MRSSKWWWSTNLNWCLGTTSSYSYKLKIDAKAPTTFDNPNGVIISGIFQP